MSLLVNTKIKEEEEGRTGFSIFNINNNNNINYTNYLSSFFFSKSLIKIAFIISICGNNNNI
jgi:hypothetical protein